MILQRPPLHWHQHFLKLAVLHAQMSKDPRTRVGAVIVGPAREVISAGFNGFPRGIKDTEERLQDKETKLKIVVHAEMNAVLAAARLGMRLHGATLYLAATDDSGKVWGGPPCHRCTVELIQAGIAAVYAYPYKDGSSWKDSLVLARELLEEASVPFYTVYP